MNMKWINSAGGPLICMERHVMCRWMGARGLSAIDPTGVKTDYDRACAVSGYTDIIISGDSDVLVLGDEPLQSSFLDIYGELSIVRWVYAQKNQDIAAILSNSIGDARECSNRVSFRVDEGNLLLFDAALQGDYALYDAGKAQTNSGQYEITTERLELKNVYSFIIHRFSIITH